MPSHIYLPKGMMGRIDCPVESNPPLTLIRWFKENRQIDFANIRHMRVSKDGTLIIKPVILSDEGHYSCTPYSPLGQGLSSSPVQVYVRGQYFSSDYFIFTVKIFSVFLFSIVVILIFQIV